MNHLLLCVVTQCRYVAGYRHFRGKCYHQCRARNEVCYPEHCSNNLPGRF